ncbi:hypothetical protein [Candidatus Reidiella endopervernicosa]|uniref:Uncharacterized protein n=1 Tax=Candidatus Reidiella endopervernicosa TaxID=2738883 RepID=A0A6N0HYH7_9GAMM|nr:hypothetical protein [Candidatus Reidiella endopervernicosa]QKQ27379.1 hypothetical protein HUE57_14640 [Candidatus Reidiella endopervernicosa]
MTKGAASATHPQRGGRKPGAERLAQSASQLEIAIKSGETSDIILDLFRSSFETVMTALTALERRSWLERRGAIQSESNTEALRPLLRSYPNAR